jgi:hypothetical protein
MPECVDEMRHTSLELARRKMTPLPHRLLHLSQQKLDRLKTGTGSRDAGTCLWKGVLVREAVRSTWTLVGQGARQDMNDWSVICKEEEEEERQEELPYEERRSEEWFDQLLANMAHDEYTGDDWREVEWTESNVSKPAYDDLEYQSEGMVAYTIPLPLWRPSPTMLPTTCHPHRLLGSAFDSLTPGINTVELWRTSAPVPAPPKPRAKPTSPLPSGPLRVWRGVSGAVGILCKTREPVREPLLEVRTG